MVIRDLPSIGSSAYGASTSTFSLANVTALPWEENTAIPQHLKQQGLQVLTAPVQQPKQEKPNMAAAPSRRLVQVFIADPDENVPLDQSLLYSGDQMLTDATDQELFFEIDMVTVLAKHNEARVKLINKKVKERTEYLEPAKIRDLKMVVVNVATF